MGKSIVIIDGHPDSDKSRFCHAIADAYADGAQAAGHQIGLIAVAGLDAPLLKSRREWETEAPPPSIQKAQAAIEEAGHLVVIYPLWLGSMPAMLKGFFEQVFRPGFAIDFGKRTLKPGRLTGKSARVIVTMGMPGFIYRWYFMAHSLKSLERNILGFVGIGPIRETLIGGVDASAARRERWLAKLAALGGRGE